MEDMEEKERKKRAEAHRVSFSLVCHLSLILEQKKMGCLTKRKSQMKETTTMSEGKETGSTRWFLVLLVRL